MIMRTMMNVDDEDADKIEDSDDGDYDNVDVIDSDDESDGDGHDSADVVIDKDGDDEHDDADKDDEINEKKKQGYGYDKINRLDSVEVVRSGDQMKRIEWAIGELQGNMMHMVKAMTEMEREFRQKIFVLKMCIPKAKREGCNRVIKERMQSEGVNFRGFESESESATSSEEEFSTSETISDSSYTSASEDSW